MKLRNGLVILMALAMAVVIAGCTASNSASEVSSSEETKTDVVEAQEEASTLESIEEEVKQPEEEKELVEPTTGQVTDSTPTSTEEVTLGILTPDQVLEKDKLVLDFALENLNGEVVQLSDYRGRLVLLNFWATSCGYCVKELPHFQEVIDNNEDVVVLAVHIAGKKEKIKKFIDDKGYNFPVLLDAKADVASAFMVSGTPTTYFISPEGIFLGGVPGYMESDYLNDLIGQLSPVQE